MYLVLSNVKNGVAEFLPVGSTPIATINYDSFKESLCQYNPKTLLVFSAMIQKPAWEWVPEILSLMKSIQTMFIIPVDEYDRYLLEQVLQRNPSPITLLHSNMTNREIIEALEGVERKETIAVPYGYVITLAGTGGAGVTTFTLHYLHWLSNVFPDLRFLGVDMNRHDKRDLAVATGAQHHHLREKRAELQRDDDALQLVPKRYLKNVDCFSAVGEWSAQEISRFLDYCRVHYDVILLDRGFIKQNDSDIQQIFKLSDEIVYCVRPDAFSIGYARKMIPFFPKDKTNLLLTQYHSGFVNKSAFIDLLGLPVMGTISHQKYMIPMDFSLSPISINKKLKQDFEQIEWRNKLLNSRMKPSFFSTSWLKQLMGGKKTHEHHVR